MKGVSMTISQDQAREMYWDKICFDAVARFGMENQKWVAVGEIGELLDAVADYRRGRCGKDHVAEELADVAVVLRQMIIGFQCVDEFEEAFKFKMERLRQNLEKETAPPKEERDA